ncbi:MAG: HD domain-containing protein [Kiritimatiellae bacterium]|nr:HD domain-containing protein [Kiritimatiellia bacterium]
MFTLDAKQCFNAYTKKFPDVEMNRLKIAHTERVVAVALEIMKRSAFPEALMALGEAAAWFHDVGRFPQFQRYQTFSDRHSVNHALLSCSEILQQGWLDATPAKSRDLILKAVEFHNLREVPPQLDPDEALLVHLVRDADKLDILALLEQAIATDYLADHPEVYWGLPFTAPLSDAVVEAIEAGASVSYKDIQSFADFVLIQVAWCNGGFHFPASCALVLERNSLAIRQTYLCSILPSGEHERIKRCCHLAEVALKRKVQNGASIHISP